MAGRTGRLPWPDPVTFASFTSTEDHMAQPNFMRLRVMGSCAAKRRLDAGHSDTGYKRKETKAQ
jgi:hypothetical protein